ncbi:MAG: hypothetical protein H6720_31730 [Sandaracinus sp.]|nr:hypothetical protein [Sandaracinus sp.]MCB9604915.1 hypothetical protein [Sandaracinus sp.]
MTWLTNQRSASSAASMASARASFVLPQGVELVVGEMGRVLGLALIAVLLVVLIGPAGTGTL